MLPIEYHLTSDDLAKTLRDDVHDGLTAHPKSLPPKWFYDERGSVLFERITELPEYYPTRAERAILERHAPDIAAATGADTLVELGAGSGAKTRCCWTRSARPGPCAGSSRSTSAETSCRSPPRASAPPTPAPTSARSSPTSNATCTCCPPPGGGWWRSSARPSATSPRPSAWPS